MKYDSLPSFDKDFKKLKKRFRTLDDDFKTLKQYHLEPFHNLNIKNDDPVEIRNMCGANFKSYKVRKFACKSLPGKGKQSGLRVIYVYHTDTKKITFAEIYFKGDKSNEDKERLKKIIATLE